MKTIKSYLFIFFILFSGILLAQDLTDIKGDYLGQTPPGDSAILFAPDVLSKYNFIHSSVAISNDIKEIFWSVKENNKEKIVWSKFEEGNWSEPAIAGFLKQESSNFNCMPVLNYDCSRLYFYSTRNDGFGGLDVWYSVKSETGWSDPVNAGSEYNSTDNDFPPRFTSKNTAYRFGFFTDTLPKKYDYLDFTFSNAVEVFDFPEFSPYYDVYISPEEDFLIFTKEKMDNDLDLYICFKNRNDGWSNPINMGEKINTGKWERHPYISPDGKYLFFDRGDGNSNKVYWISTSVIDDLRFEYNRYFGQELPGNYVEIFAPDVISQSNRLEGEIAFSPNGKEIFFTVYQTGGGNPKIFFTKYENNTWTEQQEASFSINQNVSSPSFSVDGNQLYFTKNKDIWVVERTEQGWSEAQLLPFPINSSSNERSYYVAANGLVYISSDREGGYGGGDIYCIRRSLDSTLYAENLGPMVNSSYWDFLPCIAPDGSFLIFKSMRNDYNQHLFICFRNDEGEWITPINLEESRIGINIANQNQLTPSLSPDGSILFFGRHNNSGDIFDIYWVSTDFIDEIKKKVLGTSIIHSEKEKIKIYPNPAKEILWIEYPGLENLNVSYRIIDLNGNSLVQNQLINNSVNTKNLKSGFYFLELNIRDEKIIKKISISKLH